MVEALSKELIAFILEHEKEDLSKLALKGSKYPHINMPLALQQIRGRQKIKLKLPSWYEHSDLYYPVKVSLEQSSSELTARYKASLISEPTITDLTGGMGVDSYFFSKVCEKVNYVEKDITLCGVSKHNFNRLDANNVVVMNATAEDYLRTIEEEPTKCYYLDPSRRDDYNNKVVALEDCVPRLSVVLEEVIKRKARLLVKTSPLLDIKAVAQQYTSLSEVHCVAVDNECKELLFDFNPFDESKGIVIHAVNLPSRGQKQVEKISFDMDEETEKSVALCLPQQYLYEPNAAIMKSGGYKSVALKYGVSKLHRHTHLYTSIDLKADFPGRVFQIVGQIKPNRKLLAEAIRTDKANLTVRNFPARVEELRKKLKLKDGGDYYLFACTLMDDSRVVLVCKKA